MFFHFTAPCKPQQKTEVSKRPVSGRPLLVCFPWPPFNMSAVCACVTFNNFFFSFVMLQVVYEDISHGALRQQGAIREPAQSTVYSSLRFSWRAGGKLWHEDHFCSTFCGTLTWTHGNWELLTCRTASLRHSDRYFTPASFLSSRFHLRVVKNHWSRWQNKIRMDPEEYCLPIHVYGLSWSHSDVEEVTDLFMKKSKCQKSIICM